MLYYKIEVFIFWGKRVLNKHLESLKQRDSSLDLIRIFAFFSVICVHFFMNNGYYMQPVLGKRMYVMTLLRAFFMDCVPMFLILSGFLMNQKKISKSYYVGILKTGVIYVLSSIACLLFASKSDPMSWKDFILKTLSFQGAPYAWYIEMYLGLFLLIPFLNLTFNCLQNQKQAQTLLITMLLLTAFPSVLNATHKVLPAWWISIYPITYYYIGAYLSKYPPKIKSRYLLLLLIPHILLIGTYNYIMSYNQSFVDGLWAQWGSLFNVITTVLVFLIVKNIDTQSWNVKVKALIKYISSLTLAAYLLSWIGDKIFYPVLHQKIPNMIYRLEYMGIMVIVLSVFSLLLSVVVTFLSNQILKLIHFFIKKVQEHKNKAKLKKAEF